MSHSLNIIIVDKSGTLKSLSIKDFKEEDLFKKCGFKKSENFIKHVEWNVKLNGSKYLVHVYGKDDGRANSENKYDFPPPIDKILFYGSCAIVAKQKHEDDKINYVNLSVELWEKMYEKLFGGFENLAVTALEDEEEEDELEKIPKEKKTKQGYLKDGFVVDSDGEEESEYETADESDSNESTEEESNDLDNDKNDTDIILQDIGSELSEESYEY
jgi:hypothetical protein